MNVNMKKKLGSEIFGTAEIKTDEYILAAKVITGNGASVEQAALEIEMYDDVLQMIRMRMIIVGHSFTKTGRTRKDADLLSMIERRYDQYYN